MRVHKIAASGRQLRGPNSKRNTTRPVPRIVPAYRKPTEHHSHVCGFLDHALRGSAFRLRAQNPTEPSGVPLGDNEANVDEEEFDEDEEEEEFEQEAETNADEDTTTTKLLQEVGGSRATMPLPPAPLARQAPRSDLDDDEDLEEDELEAEEDDLPHRNYPDLPIRTKYLSDAFAMVDLIEIAMHLDQSDVKDPVIGGLQNDAARVEEGDLFFCPPLELGWLEGEPGPAELSAKAVEKGAAAIVTQDEIAFEQLPEGFPVVLVDDVEAVQALMAAAWYEQPSTRTDVVAVTGSLGKTTVSWLVRGVLEEMGRRVGMVGSLEWALDELYLDQDGEWWASPLPDSTDGRDCSAPFHVSKYQGRYECPDAKLDSLTVQKVLAGIADRGGEAAVLEVHPICAGQGRVAYVRPRVAVFTNLSEKDPLEITASAEQWARCAGRVFDGMEDAEKQRAVVNIDDPMHKWILEASKVPVVTYSTQNLGADVRLESSRTSQWETEMVVATPQGRLQIITPLMGRHNISNVLAAVAVGVALGAPLEVIVRGVEAVEVVPGRCEIIDEGQAFPVIVDAASSPEELGQLLDAVRETRKGRVFLVVGCPGDSDRGPRPYLGEVAHLKADYVILTNDSPRTEDPDAIIQDIVAGFPEEVLNIGADSAYWFLQDPAHAPLWFEPYLQSMQQLCHRYVMEDRWSAIRAAIGTAAEGDVVVIAGRGAQEVVEHSDDGGHIIRGWFDDRVEARNALSKLPSLNQLKQLPRDDLPWGNTLKDEFDTLVV